MRRRILLSTAAAGLALAAIAVPSSGATTTRATTTADRTAPHGRLAVKTVGLGATSSYGEPSFAWAPDGKHGIICTPGSNNGDGSTVQFWYTSNTGRTWKHSEETSPNGGGDCTIEYLPDGTVVSADLEISDSYIQESTNWGKTWKPVGTAGQQQDRQWLAHSPNGKKVYLVYHDFAAEAEWYAVGSYDKKTRKLTFDPADCCNSAQSANQATAPGIAQTQEKGTPSAVDEGGNTFSGPILVDPSDKTGKTMYVIYSISDLQSNVNPEDGVPPYGPTRGIVVATTTDGGQTWDSHYAVQSKPNPDGATEPITSAIFPWGSIDRAGNLYVVYNSTIHQKADHYHQYYVYSKDHGKHWSKPVKLDRLKRNHGAAIYATSAASRRGKLDVAWYQTNNGTPSSTSNKVLWRPHMAAVTHANSSHPRVRQQSLTKIPNHRGGICLEGILCGVGPGSSDRSLLDFFQIGINPRTGRAGIAYADNAGARPGHVKGEVVFAKQARRRHHHHRHHHR